MPLWALALVLLNPERSVKRPFFFFFNESSKLYFDLHDKTEEENFDKNNDNLRYLEDISGNCCKSLRAKQRHNI